MPDNELAGTATPGVAEDEQTIVHLNPTQKYDIEIPGAPKSRHQTLDFARHIAASPDGKHYVVATFDDRHMGRGFVTAAYPQQNGYMTLVRLPAIELSSSDVETALQRHKDLVLAIQQGRLKAFIQENQENQ